MAVAMFAACDEGEGQKNNDDVNIPNGTDASSDDTDEPAVETKVFYNDDGTMDREEYYYEDGTLKKVRVQNHDFYNVINFEETYYSQSGKIVSVIYYSGLGDFNEEKECMNYVYYYKDDYDENENYIKSTTYMDTDVSYTFDDNDSFYSYTIFEYDADDHMIKEVLYDENEKIVRYTDFEYNSEGALIKEITYNSTGSIDYAVEYDSNKTSDIGVIISLYDGNRSYYTQPMYRYFDETTWKEKNDYERILKLDVYRDDGTLSKHIERIAEGKMSEINYLTDGNVASEKIIDYDGNKIE
jgi:hypothetical protein